MTEQPDTAAIRESAGKTRWPTWSQMLDLCDALDDARGARDYWRNINIDLKRQEATNAALLAGAYEVSRKAIDRAAAAEADLAETREERNWLSRGDLNNTMSAYRAHREVDDAVKARLNAAEARIAAALAFRVSYDKTPSAEYRRGAEDTLQAFRRALTEGTGQ